MVMAGRMQSPSSINTYKQCPRKYYYSYIEKLPTKPNIHLVLGTIVHETLEEFFSHLVQVNGDLANTLQFHVLNILKQRWDANDKDIQKLDLTAAEIVSYKHESSLMLLNWLQHFIREHLEPELKLGVPFMEAFRKHTPRTEAEFRSEELQVRGFIDAIHEFDGKVHIRDYKTSKNPILSEEYKLQLAIYALLYKREHGKIPDTLGIFFLKHGERLLDIDENLLTHADLEIRWAHERTQTNDIKDYDKKPSPLCNYCDFYDACFKQKELKEF